MIEVEVKAKVDNFEDIKRLLNELNAVKIRTERQEDTYFNAPHRDFAETDEALRIREIPEKTASKIFITYKGPKIDKNSKTRKEFEVDVGDAQITSKIFENLGFRAVESVVKDREIYELDDFIITLDTVQRVGTYMEIEKDLLEGEDYNQTLDEIFELYKKLEITEGFERRSYLELMEI